MADEKQRCKYPGCRAEAVLRELIPDPNARPVRVQAGEEIPRRSRLRAWVCQMNPKRHIEVIGWGFRPTKDCSVAGCDGVMIHTARARFSAPEGSEVPVRKTYPRLEQHGGFLCMTDESHVELDA